MTLVHCFERPDGVKLALERRFGRSGDAKLGLDRRFGPPDGAKLALDRRFGCSDGAKLPQEKRFRRPDGAKVALERRFWKQMSQIARPQRNTGHAQKNRRRAVPMAPSWPWHSVKLLLKKRRVGPGTASWATLAPSWP